MLHLKLKVLKFNKLRGIRMREKPVDLGKIQEHPQVALGTGHI